MLPHLRSLTGMPLGWVERAAGIDAFEARLLLCHALGLTRVQLITASERELSEDEAQRIAALFERRQRGEPIAYLLGSREFYGLELRVSPSVLIPRPETELLVELALARAPLGARVVDLGTGSGAIAIALAHTRADLQVSAVDLSEDALVLARGNAATHGADIRFVHSDWYAGLDAMSTLPPVFDLIVSNPPYIVNGDPHLVQGDLRFEPIDALTDHDDGLSAIRTIISGAPAHLKSGGWLLFEHGYDQADAARALLTAAGMHEVQSWRDLAGIERVSGARLA